MNNHKPSLGLRFDNSYLDLPAFFYTCVQPVAVVDPQLVVLNTTLAEELGLQLEQFAKHELASIFSGNTLPEGAQPLAQAYAGHQFGHFTMLGDGRAHLLGEHLTAQGQRVDIQLKGSGQTPYSRRGDGRAALGPMLREYIISEGMYALNVPTTRSLAVVSTGESVIRESLLPGAILTRVAASHIRVGTFEFAAQLADKCALKQLADYTIKRHYQQLAESAQPYLALLLSVIDKQVTLMTEWLRVGFIHGVMNTDNMAISGETIDYGPCAFMDNYDPATVFSSIDHAGRYAYANQPAIGAWNIARLTKTLLPLINAHADQSSSLIKESVNVFHEKFQQQWLDMMRRKLGLISQEIQDVQLIDELLQWMQANHADYTNTFRDLSTPSLPDENLYHADEFQSWWQRWQARLHQNGKPLSSALSLMRANNPVIIPRNHKVQAALYAAEAQSDFTKLHTLLKALADPYDYNTAYLDFYEPPKPSERVYQTFCGT